MIDLKFDPTNIIVSGVGGQGNILASDLISRAFSAAGLLVSVGETYGATQRGGAVVSHIRASLNRTYGPLIPSGRCHMIIGFEPLEVYRLLKDGASSSAWVVTNNRAFVPLDVLRKRTGYPETRELLKAVEGLSERLKVLDGTRLAAAAGHPQCLNVVMVGAFAGLSWMPVDKSLYIKALEETFSGERLGVNLRAFEAGFFEASSQGVCIA